MNGILGSVSVGSQGIPGWLGENRENNYEMTMRATEDIFLYLLQIFFI